MADFFKLWYFNKNDLQREGKREVRRVFVSREEKKAARKKNNEESPFFMEKNVQKNWREWRGEREKKNKTHT